MWRDVYIVRLLLGCISNFREIGEILLDLLNLKDMGYTCCHKQSCECSFRYCIYVSIFKAIGQLLMGVLHFKDWGTQCYLELGGPCTYNVDASGFTGVRRGEGDAENNNIT